MNFKILFIAIFSCISLFSFDKKMNVDDVLTEFRGKYEGRKGYYYLQLDNSLNFNFINGVITPLLGVGFRDCVGSRAVEWNVGMELSPFFKSKKSLYCYSANLNLLKYFGEPQSSDYYLGIGLNLLGTYCKNFFLLLRSPAFIIGKEFRENKALYFIQLKVLWPNIPTLTVNEKFYSIPRNERQKRMWSSILFISTGIGF